ALGAHAKPRDHASFITVSDFDPGDPGNGGSDANSAGGRWLGEVLDRVASDLRCGVYYSLSGVIRDNSSRRMKRLFSILSFLTAVLLVYGLYQALVAAPTERTMGDVQRIFYYHVPSAWTAFCLFFTNLFASIAYLIWKNSKADALAV